MASAACQIVIHFGGSAFAVAGAHERGTAMKKILLPVESNTTFNAAFAVADLLGARFASQIDGVALKPGVITFVTADPVVVLVSQPASTDAETEKSARALFDKLNAGRTPPGKAVFKWRDGGAIDDNGLSSLSRAYDITIVGRPGLKQSEPRMTTLEVALFESGRPILMAPPQASKTLGTNILVHWNASNETARAINDAMPLLRQAEQVTMVTVEGAMVPGPKAADMLDYLAAHGIRGIESKVKPAAKSSTGEAILAEARRLGADLLIKGAYTQSRLRQMIFGGATQHILQSADIPVMLSH